MSSGHRRRAGRRAQQCQLTFFLGRVVHLHQQLLITAEMVRGRTAGSSNVALAGSSSLHPLAGAAIHWALPTTPGLGPAGICLPTASRQVQAPPLDCFDEAVGRGSGADLSGKGISVRRQLRILRCPKLHRKAAGGALQEQTIHMHNLTHTSSRYRVHEAAVDRRVEGSTGGSAAAWVHTLQQVPCWALGG